MNQIIPRDNADTLDVVEQSTAIAPSLVGQLVKAEIDQQIATAHQYPRNLTRVRNNILSLTTMTEQSAEECGYALPRGNKPVVGPSIRLAEIVMQQFGNCRAAARVVHVDRFEKYVEAEGVFHDLETNSATTARVRRRIVDRNGRLYNDDMIIVTGNAACSIAKRNAILAGVPKALWGQAYEAAMQVVKGDLKTLSEKIEALTKVYGAMGVTMDQVCEYLEIPDQGALTVDHVATMGVIARTIRNGEAQVEDYFRKPTEAQQIEGQKRGTAKSLGDIAAEGEGAKGGKPEAGQSQPQGEQIAVQDEAADSAIAAQGAAETGGKSDQRSEVSTGHEEEADQPTEEDIADAEQRGRKAATAGRTRESAPKAIKNTPELLAAWNRGFDAEEAAANEAG